MSKSEILAAIHEVQTSLDIHFQATNTLFQQLMTSIDTSITRLSSLPPFTHSGACSSAFYASQPPPIFPPPLLSSHNSPWFSLTPTTTNPPHNTHHLYTAPFPPPSPAPIYPQSAVVPPPLVEPQILSRSEFCWSLKPQTIPPKPLLVPEPPPPPKLHLPSTLPPLCAPPPPPIFPPPSSSPTSHFPPLDPQPPQHKPQTNPSPRPTLPPSIPPPPTEPPPDLSHPLTEPSPTLPPLPLHPPLPTNSPLLLPTHSFPNKQKRARGLCLNCDPNWSLTRRRRTPFLLLMGSKDADEAKPPNPTLLDFGVDSIVGDNSLVVLFLELPPKTPLICFNQLRAMANLEKRKPFIAIYIRPNSDDDEPNLFLLLRPNMSGLNSEISATPNPSALPHSLPLSIFPLLSLPPILFTPNPLPPFPHAAYIGYFMGSTGEPPPAAPIILFNHLRAMASHGFKLSSLMKASALDQAYEARFDKTKLESHSLHRQPLKASPVSCVPPLLTAVMYPHFHQPLPPSLSTNPPPFLPIPSPPITHLSPAALLIFFSQMQALVSQEGINEILKIHIWHFQRVEPNSVIFLEPNPSVGKGPLMFIVSIQSPTELQYLLHQYRHLFHLPTNVKPYHLEDKVVVEGDGNVTTIAIIEEPIIGPEYIIEILGKKSPIQVMFMIHHKECPNEMERCLIGLKDLS